MGNVTNIVKTNGEKKLTRPFWGYIAKALEGGKYSKSYLHKVLDVTLKALLLVLG